MHHAALVLLPLVSAHVERPREVFVFKGALRPQPQDFRKQHASVGVRRVSRVKSRFVPTLDGLEFFVGHGFIVSRSLDSTHGPEVAAARRALMGSRFTGSVMVNPYFRWVQGGH